MYFSGIRNANDWTTAEGGTFLTSGFMDLEEHHGGDRLVALHGPWQGLIICVTDKTIQVIDANFGDPATFSRRTIIYGLGGVAANGTTTLGNELVYQSRRGLHQLGTVEKFGDIETTYLSFPIDGMWSGADTSEDAIATNRLPFTWAATYRPHSWAMWLLALNASSTNTHILVYDARVETFYLWGISALCATEFSASDETGLYMLLGRYDGYIDLLGHHLPDDNGTDFTFNLETARLDFRDYPDPNVQLRDHMKKFKSIHIHLRPLTATAQLTLTVQVDEKTPQTFTVIHDPFAKASLGAGFTLGPTGVGQLTSPERVAVVSQPIDCHGKYIKVGIAQSTGPVHIHGIEFDFEDEGLAHAYV